MDPLLSSSTHGLANGSDVPPDYGARASEHVDVELVGLAAVVFSCVYFASDVIEWAQGGFSNPQLVLTYAGEAAIPLFVLGLYAVQRPNMGRLGLFGAIAYAYTFVFFTGTVLVALVDHTPNWDALVQRVGPAITIHGAVMVVAGVAFGWAVVRARVLPRWSGALLMFGVGFVSLSSGLPEPVQILAAGARDAAFVAMGVAVLAKRPVLDADRRIA
jgi:hypothetical protein